MMDPILDLASERLDRPSGWTHMNDAIVSAGRASSGLVRLEFLTDWGG